MLKNIVQVNAGWKLLEKINVDLFLIDFICWITYILFNKTKIAICSPSQPGHSMLVVKSHGFIFVKSRGAEEPIVGRGEGR